MRAVAMAMAMAAALAATACGGGTDSGKVAAPVKQLPGSWTNKIQIVKLDAGPGVDSTKIKEGMQSMFDAFAGRGVCITEAMVAKNNVEANIRQLAAQGKKCDFSRKIQDGELIDFAGVCSEANGSKVKIAITGTNGPTTQDMVIVSEPVDAGGTARGSMELKMEGRRTGDCKAGDMQMPVAPAAS